MFGLKIPQRLYGPNQGGYGGGQAGGKDGLGGGKTGGNNGGKKNEGKQVYSGPIGPTKTGDPLGGPSQHFAEKGSGLLGALDSMFGYDNVGQRVNAYNNNPARASTPVAYVPSYPWASPGYVAASILGAPMSPMGALMSVPGIAKAIATNSPYEGMAQKMAEYMGAERGPQGPDVGVGHDLGGKGGNMQPGSGYALPQGYMGGQTPIPNSTVSPTAQQPQTTVPQMTNPAEFLSPTPGYGVWAPQYSYFGANTPATGKPGLPMNQNTPRTQFTPNRPFGSDWIR